MKNTIVLKAETKQKKIVLLKDCTKRGVKVVTDFLQFGKKKAIQYNIIIEL